MTPLEAAEWANIAYENEEKGREFAASRGFSFVLFQAGPHQCVFATKADLLVIAIRGTQFSRGKMWERIKDTISNLMMGQVECQGAPGMVHEGYHEGVWELLRLLIPRIKNRKKVVIVGHSMGGVMAIIMGAILKPKAVYAFNAPKPGNKVFAINYPVPLFRFVSKRDWAQGIPSSTPNWVHPKGKIGLDSKGHSMDRIVEVLS